ncbi:MAG TPA: hypothetical protein VGI93_12535 [Steroidobacteraceae bacterium]|jgi:hypothetical protein
MSERHDDTMTIGLLLESAQTQQRLAEQSLESLRVHTQSLDVVARDEFRRVLTEELQPLDAEIARLARSAARAARNYSLRTVIFGLATTTLCALVPVGVARWVLPSTEQVAELKAQREVLTQQLQVLKAQGARMELRRCGTAARLCVRIDENAPRFGEHADFHVPAGY